MTRWSTTNKRHKRKTRILSTHDYVVRMLYRYYRACGYEHERALDEATPRYLYPVLTPIRNFLPRINSDGTL